MPLTLEPLRKKPSFLGCASLTGSLALGAHKGGHARTHGSEKGSLESVCRRFLDSMGSVKYVLEGPLETESILRKG